MTSCGARSEADRFEVHCIARERAMAKPIGISQRCLEEVAGLGSVSESLAAFAFPHEPRVFDALQAVVRDVDDTCRVELAFEKSVLHAATHEVVPGPYAQAPAGRHIGELTDHCTTIVSLHHEVGAARREDEGGARLTGNGKLGER